MKNKKNSIWSDETIILAEKLHNELAINNYDWHKYKNNSSKRAAELISGALIKIINHGDNNDINTMLKQSMLWLNKEINDPGCPNH